VHVEPDDIFNPIPALARIARVLPNLIVLCLEALRNVPSSRIPTWPAVNSQRAFGGTSTLWLYFAAGGAMADGLHVLSILDLLNGSASPRVLRWVSE
jgi:hypothetical protein